MTDKGPKEKPDPTEDTGSYWEYDDEFEEFEGTHRNASSQADHFICVYEGSNAAFTHQKGPVENRIALHLQLVIWK